MEGVAQRDSLQIERRPDGVSVLRFDVSGDSVNTLGADFADDFEAALSALDSDSELRAVVFTSGKPEGFIAGADIRMLRTIELAERASELSSAGQRALSRLSSFRVPVIAAIHGACLGGGLELALACSARVGSTHETTQLGLPEVQLGISPALGGTQRLPRLIGLRAALELLLTGKRLDAKRALGLGLIDELVPASILLEVAIKFSLSQATQRRAHRSRLGRFFDRGELLLVDTALGRKLVLDRAERQLSAETHGNHAAPLRILQVVKLGLAQGIERGLEAEARAFGELVVSAEARALRHVFFATRELKKDLGRDVALAREVRHVGTLGAGLIGAGFAYVTAVRAELTVRMKDQDDAALGKGLKYVRKILDEQVQAQRIHRNARDLGMARITVSTDYEGFDGLDLVLEALSEDLSLKRQVLAEVEAFAGKRAIFASNTSSIPITRIAEGARRPGQVIGMHYFSPVHEVPLLEVVVTAQTEDWVRASCVQLGKRQGKTVIVVNDGAGFYTSRILGPYLSEASFLVAEGVPIERIDQALVEWGFPVGPLALLDEVGIDVGAKVGRALYEAFGERMALPPGIDELLKDQRFGKKNQRGFYSYGEQRHKPVDRSVYALLGIRPDRAMPAPEIALRCALRMINEALHCFGEGILRSARDGDVGAMFGLGFPRFRGGPFYFVDSAGAAELVRQLEAYRDTLGVRFSPAPVLTEMAKSGTRFYDGPAAVAAGQHRA